MVNPATTNEMVAIIMIRISWVLCLMFRLDRVLNLIKFPLCYGQAVHPLAGFENRDS